MKFLLDVCVSSRSLQTFLGGKGHDAVSALAIDPKAGDERLMPVALQEERVLVTEDKDFGLTPAGAPLLRPTMLCDAVVGRSRRSGS